MSKRAKTRTEQIDIELGWNQLEELNSKATIVAQGGGYGSGKSFNNAVLLLKWGADGETEQRYGLFANTANQAKSGALAEIEENLDEWGIDHIYGTRPPESWKREWRRGGIKVPALGADAKNTFILRNGIHVVVGGLENNSYKRFKSFAFRRIIVEELAEQRSSQPLEFLLARLRCGKAKGRPTCGHLHQAYLRWNPPSPTQPHWLRKWVKDHREAETMRRAHGEPEFFRYIQTSTQDNVENVSPDYIAKLRAGLSAASARALIDGDLDQRLEGRTYYEFGPDNIIPIGYDNARPVYLSFDMNWNPSVATLSHRLYDEEVPERYRNKGLEFFGTFGEFFHVGGMDVERLMKALLRGEKELGGHWPENFTGLINHQNPVRVHGDASGGQHRAESPEGKSAWKRINALGFEHLGKRYNFDAPKANPTIQESIDILLGKMHADNGDRSYFVDQRCTALINDFENVVPKDDGTELIAKAPGTMLTHISDSLRYVVAALFRNQLKKPSWQPYASARY